MRGGLVAVGVVVGVVCAVGCDGDDSSLAPRLAVTPAAVERLVAESFEVVASVTAGRPGEVSTIEVTVIDPGVVGAVGGPDTLMTDGEDGIYVFDCLAEGATTLRFRAYRFGSDNPFDTKEVAATCLEEDVTPGTCALQGDFRGLASFTPRSTACAGATAFEDELAVSFEGETARFEQPSTGDVNEGSLDGDCAFAVESASGNESYEGSCDESTRRCTAVNVYTDTSGCVTENDVVLTLAPPLVRETVPDGTSCGTEVVRLPISGRQSDIIQIAPDELVVANGSGGVSYLDVSDPSAPGEIELIFVSGVSVGQIDVQGSLLAGADGPVDTGAGGTILFVDHTDLADPVEVGRWDPGSVPSVVEANGGTAADQLSVVFGAASDLLFVALEGAVVALDVSDPGAAVPISAVSLTRGASPTLVDSDGGILVHGSVSAEGGGTLTVLDASDPAGMVVLGETDVEIEPLGIEVLDGFLYAGGEAGEVAVFDMASDTPQTTHLFEMPRSPTWGVADAGGGYAIASSGNAGLGRLDLFDVSDPAAPEWVAQSDAGTVGGARAAVVVGDHAYVAAGNEGVRVIDIAACRP